MYRQLNMQFNNNQSIYIQIAALLEEEILSGRWQEEERIPSVRELGMELEVNPNTVMRSFEMAQADELIYNKRGLGYFVKKGARVVILTRRKKDFTEQEIPAFVQKMQLLQLNTAEILAAINKLLNNNEKE
jgi:GntR family transcriptional regulator